MRLRFRPAAPGPDLSDVDPDLSDVEVPAAVPPAPWHDHAGLVTERVETRRYAPSAWPDTATRAVVTEDEHLRPLYARVLRLRHVEPGAVLCFVFFEGTVVLGFLLALAELVSWWGVVILPASVALMVKINDVVAAAVARSAARVPEIEQERFRRELQPAIGRAVVTGARWAAPVPAAGHPGYPHDPGHPYGPAGNGALPVSRVRPELATARTRPRPVSMPESRTGGLRRGRDGHPAQRAADDPADTGPAADSGHEASRSVRRARNAHPMGWNGQPTRGRGPSYLPDRRDPGTNVERWIRQSARRRYGVTDQPG